jgi:hypothetical protein
VGTLNDRRDGGGTVVAGFSVDCEELVRVANELRSVHTDLLDAIRSLCEMLSGEFDDPELAMAIRHFDDSSRHAVHALSDDATAAADRLTGNATRYRAAQQRVMATLDGLVD